MKFKIISLFGLCLCAGVLLLTGCSTTGGNPLANTNTLAHIQSVSKVAAYVGTHEYVAQHPESRPQFEIARDALNTIATGEHVDLATLLAIVNQLPVKELKSETAQLSITAGTILLTEYADRLPVDKLDNLKPVARAIADGITLGLK